MDGDAAATAPDQRDSGAGNPGARRRICRYVLLIGAIGGIVIGVADDRGLAATGWIIPNHGAVAPDLPLFSTVVAANSVFHFLTWTKSDLTFWEVAIIIYWAVVGTFLTSLVCFVRTGWSRLGVAAFRRAIFFGAGAGVVVAALDLAVSANGQEPNWLRALHWPANALMEIVESQVRLHALMTDNVYTYYRLLVVVCYWAAVGSLLAILFCLLRAARNRKAVGEPLVPAE